MNFKQAQPLIPIERIQNLVQLELGLLIFGLAVGAMLIYKLFMRGISAERHRSLSRHFQNLGFHLAIAVILFLAYAALSRIPDPSINMTRGIGYLGLATLIQGSVVFVKVARIYIFEYLFLSHMRVGVPLLLINLSTLCLTVILAAWLVSEVFNIRLGPLLATSAVFSLVVGLALQDTLGNLFAGVALQFDKPYEIGDWIEIQNGSQKWIGQVQEISWRATLLIGFADELITVPNRVMGSSQISNYATRLNPIARSQLFRFPFDASIDRAKAALLRATVGVEGIVTHPRPMVLVNEATESWILFKLIYFIRDLGKNAIITDRVLSQALHELQQEGVSLASPRIEVHQARETQASEEPLLP